jgi:hypothetical protein
VHFWQEIIENGLLKTEIGIRKWKIENCPVAQRKGDYLLVENCQNR